MQIPDDKKLVSLDVKSLFTSIPLQLALQSTETAIQQSNIEPTEDIMGLLNLRLTSTYFLYNGKHYKHLHGTAMGSPISVPWFQRRFIRREERWREGENRSEGEEKSPLVESVGNFTSMLSPSTESEPRR